eukprot:5798517-Amphidinium_carterae.1
MQPYPETKRYQCHHERDEPGQKSKAGTYTDDDSEARVLRRWLTGRGMCMQAYRAALVDVGVGTTLKEHFLTNRLLRVSSSGTPPLPTRH